MAEKNNDVKKIIEFIQAKIDNLKKKIKDYDSPFMQERIKTSQHLQFEYTRLSAALEENEETLLIIQKFNPEANVASAAKKKDKVKKKETPKKSADGAGEQK